MKKLIYSLLLLPLFTLAQERQIGTYSGGVYSFNWNMKTVVQKAMPGQTIDSVFVQGMGLKIIFKDSGNAYTDYMSFNAYSGQVFTVTSGGCLNSCWGDCSICGKQANCTCKCSTQGLCQAKNLGIFGIINISNGIRQHILTHPNPEQ